MKPWILVLFASLCAVPCAAFAAARTDLPPDVKTLPVNGYDMAYVERGSGPVLVLVHGALSDYRTWAALMNDLTAENRVIAVSLRHYYPERWDGQGNDFSLYDHARDVAAFIEALGSGPVHLLGHSRGAGVALLAAVMHPERVRSLVLADAYPFESILPKDARVNAEMASRSAVGWEVLAHYERQDPEGGLVAFVNHIAGPQAWDNTGEAQRERLRSNAWTQLSLITDTKTRVTCDDIARVGAPTLIVTGDRSPALYGYANDAVQDCLQNVSRSTIAEAGHMMFHANPTAFTFEVQFFVADH